MLAACAALQRRARIPYSEIQTPLREITKTDGSLQMLTSGGHSTGQILTEDNMTGTVRALGRTMSSTDLRSFVSVDSLCHRRLNFPNLKQSMAARVRCRSRGPFSLKIH